MRVTVMTTNPAIEMSGGVERPVEGVERVAEHLDDDHHQEHATAAAATVSYLRWPYGWSSSGGRPAARTPTRPTTFDAGVGEGVEAVGENADGAARVAEGDLGDGDDQVEQQDAGQDTRDRGVTADDRSRGRELAARRALGAGRPSQNTRASGTGHQRSCTLPMMYFFGTMPQWRLSELLFRWSPITK